MLERIARTGSTSCPTWKARRSATGSIARIQALGAVVGGGGAAAFEVAIVHHTDCGPAVSPTLGLDRGWASHVARSSRR